MYSNPCNITNKTIKKVVNMKPYKVSFLLPLIKAWCPIVIVTPEANNIIVFNKGNSLGDIGSIPAGGQAIPISIVGFKEECKYAQNKEANINISLNTNK